MANGLKKNLQVLADQLRNAREAIELDIITGRDKWRRKDYAGALHTFIFGPPAEVFEHMHRWVFYGFMGWLVWCGAGLSTTIFIAPAAPTAAPTRISSDALESTGSVPEPAVQCPPLRRSRGRARGRGAARWPRTPR